MSITHEQLEILRHTLGAGHRGARIGWRNYYAIGSESDSWTTMQQLVQLRLMERGPNLDGGLTVFRATKAGVLLVVNSAADTTIAKVLHMLRKGACRAHKDTFRSLCTIGPDRCFGCECVQFLAKSEELCRSCDAPATCVGQYEGHGEYEPSCDDCCGHGNEDGICVRIAPDVFEEVQE